MLLQRIITAIILIPIVLLLLFYLPPPVFGVLSALLFCYAAWEWTSLMQMERTAYRLLYLLIIIFILFNVMFVPVRFILTLTFIWWLFATFLILIYPVSLRLTKNILLTGIAGIMVLVPCWVALNYLRIQVDGIAAILYLFILIWGADSAAYFVGRKWGKIKLAPKVSPGKSVQGLLGACIFTLSIALLVQFYFEIPQQMWGYGIVISLIVTLFSVIGDLFESMIKRSAGVKDSGQLLPGHGGLLDRIDSLTAAAPIFAFCAVQLGNYLR